VSGARARRAAVAVLVTATAALAAGCGGSSHGEAAAPHTGHPRAGARASASASASAPAPHAAPTSSPEGGKKKPTKPSGHESMVPTSELTPVTGTFTKRQKEYLAGRVPEGTDPAAVLQAGQEACSRIKSTVSLDRKAVVSALKSGEIPGAKPAVEHLCPTFRPLLRDAGLTD
jgi:hypothetical protein